MPPASSELRYEDYLANSHRPAFDGMRGIGFLLVITAHIPSVPLFGYLQGWTAVWVFFATSGYLVTMLMIREEKSHGGWRSGRSWSNAFSGSCRATGWRS